MTFKPELIRKVWEKVNVGKEGYKERHKYDDVELIINTFLKEISQCMIDGEDICLVGFGKFVSNIRKGRIGFDPICMKKMWMPERRVIKFNISREIDKHIVGDRKIEKFDE